MIRVRFGIRPWGARHYAAIHHVPKPTVFNVVVYAYLAFNLKAAYNLFCHGKRIISWRIQKQACMPVCV
jgi:hypothetical protein